MPLHDWTDRRGFDALHLLWLAELVRDLVDKLPPGFQVVVGSSPFITFNAESGKPDLAAIRLPDDQSAPETPGLGPEPDAELLIDDLQSDATLLVERDRGLVAAIELISARNKDRPDARDYYGSRYLNYLRAGVHLMLVDVHRRPRGFSFSQWIAREFNRPLPWSPSPVVTSYRAGPALGSDGRRLAVWHRALVVDEPLPEMPLPIDFDRLVMVDLEGTYSRAAALCYIR